MKTSSAIESLLELSGDPDLAQNQWESLDSQVPADLRKSKGWKPLLHLLGNSRFLVDHLCRHPESLKDMLEDTCWERKKDLARRHLELQTLMESQFAGTLTSIQKILRLYKYREMSRIAARELSGLSTFEETGEDLSELAAACTELAYRAALKILPPLKGKNPPPFAVIGLGKLGGKDLNFSSDIDVLFVYRSSQDSKLPEEKTFFEFSVQVAETITKILQERTSEGIVFRVDLDLRPEGKSGVLVNSLEAISTYYEVSGAAWERAALTKARIVAGDQALGEDFIRDVEPFVYPKLIDIGAASDLKKMKEKINREKIKRNEGYNVKLGVGGIREIEFFATAFQRIYGGKDIELRERNTLKLLRHLEQRQKIPTQDAEALKAAYIFLRRTENFLQMEEERQTHTLPQDLKALLALARRMGFSATEPFLKDLKQKTDFVSACFEKLVSS